MLDMQGLMSGKKASFWNVTENVAPRESERSRVQSCDYFCEIHASESSSDHLLIIWTHHDATCGFSHIQVFLLPPKKHKSSVNVTGRLTGFKVKHSSPAVEVVGDLWPFSLMACWKSDGAVWALSLDETVESTLFHQGGSEVTETDTSGDGTVWAWQITFCCYVATRCLSVTQQTNAAVMEMSYDYLCGRRFFLDGRCHKWIATGWSVTTLSLLQANTGAWLLGGPLPPSILNIYLFSVINPFTLSSFLSGFTEQCSCKPHYAFNRRHCNFFTIFLISQHTRKWNDWRPILT